MSVITPNAGNESSSCWRLHRPNGVRSIASLHSSQNLGPDLEQTAAKRRICIGLTTEAAERIGFVREVCPTLGSGGILSKPGL